MSNELHEQYMLALLGSYELVLYILIHSQEKYLALSYDKATASVCVFI